MASLLKIKPTRKEILGLITEALRRKKQERQQALQEEIFAARKPYEERRKKWKEKCDELRKTALEEPEELKKLRKYAKKLGLTESSSTYASRIAYHFEREITVPIKQIELPEEPNYTPAEQAKIDNLSKQLEQVSKTLIHESCIVGHLIDNNSELFKEIEAVAEKISVGVEQTSVKLLAGTVA